MARREEIVAVTFATPLLSVSPLVPTAYIQNLYDPFSLANVKQDTVVSDTEAVAGKAQVM